MLDAVGLILDLHKARPNVQARLKLAIDTLWNDNKLVSDVCDINKLRSILNILQLCGDFEIQCLMVQMLVREEDVIKYKSWFAAVWFAKIPSCMPTFIATNDNDEDIAKFVYQYNSEHTPCFVYSVPCSFLYWKGNPLAHAREGLVLLSINCGTKTICITGIEKIPAVLNVRGLLSLKAKIIKEVNVYTVQLPYGPVIQGLSIDTSEGNLLAHPDPPIDEKGWRSINEFLHAVADIDLNFVKPSNTSEIIPQDLNDKCILKPGVEESLPDASEKMSPGSFNTEAQLEHENSFKQTSCVALVSSSQENTMGVIEDKTVLGNESLQVNDPSNGGVDLSAVDETAVEMQLDTNDIQNPIQSSVVTQDGCPRIDTKMVVNAADICDSHKVLLESSSLQNNAQSTPIKKRTYKRASFPSGKPQPFVPKNMEEFVTTGKKKRIYRRRDTTILSCLPPRFVTNPEFRRETRSRARQITDIDTAPKTNSPQKTDGLCRLRKIRKKSLKQEEPASMLVVPQDISDQSIEKVEHFGNMETDRGSQEATHLSRDELNKLNEHSESDVNTVTESNTEERRVDPEVIPANMANDNDLNIENVLPPTTHPLSLPTLQTPLCSPKREGSEDILADFNINDEIGTHDPTTVPSLMMTMDTNFNRSEPPPVVPLYLSLEENTKLQEKLGSTVSFKPRVIFDERWIQPNLLDSPVIHDGEF